MTDTTAVRGETLTEPANRLPQSQRRWSGARAAAVIALALQIVVASAQEVIPDFFKEPGLNPNRDYVNQTFNEHIDPFNGALQLHYVDLHIPGNGGFDLSVVRSYNTASIEYMNPVRYESLAGVGWNIHFGRLLKGHRHLQLDWRHGGEQPCR